NTDSSFYGGSDVGNFGGVEADGPGWSGQPHSATVNLPPLGAVWLVPEAPVSRPPIEQESQAAQPADERRELQETSGQAAEESVVSPAASATDKP
ncbi:MAG: alpha amylase C-terminal domain-containing protein, partial [Actinomycetota bacterium]|nr:alpha amylase C-terminal domain-containing protein [Actinomycetota bacterium]